MNAPTLLLASASPRRQLLLREAGFVPKVVESDIDDATLSVNECSPRALVMALSWFKAQRVRYRAHVEDAVIVAADTMCVHGRELVGKPRDRAHARSMICAMRSQSHEVATGVSLLWLARGLVMRRMVFVDVATVRLGAILDADIDAYVATDGWRGKAGGYNLSERIAAGWPIECVGDPTSVMGLPMRRLAPLLVQLDVPRVASDDARPKDSSAGQA